MDEHVHRASTFWHVASSSSELAYVLWPFLLLVATAIWVCRTRSAANSAALLGSALVALGHVTHLTAPGLRFVSMGGWVQPAFEVNSLLAFSSLAAIPLGMLVFALGLGIACLKRTSQPGPPSSP